MSEAILSEAVSAGDVIATARSYLGPVEPQPAMATYVRETLERKLTERSGDLELAARSRQGEGAISRNG